MLLLCCCDSTHSICAEFLLQSVCQVRWALTNNARGLWPVILGLYQSPRQSQQCRVVKRFRASTRILGILYCSDLPVTSFMIDSCNRRIFSFSASVPPTSMLLLHFEAFNTYLVFNSVWLSSRLNGDHRLSRAGRAHTCLVSITARCRRKKSTASVLASTITLNILPWFTRWDVADLRSGYTFRYLVSLPPINAGAVTRSTHFIYCFHSTQSDWQAG